MHLPLLQPLPLPRLKIAKAVILNLSLPKTLNALATAHDASS